MSFDPRDYEGDVLACEDFDDECEHIRIHECHQHNCMADFADTFLCVSCKRFFCGPHLNDEDLCAGCAALNPVFCQIINRFRSQIPTGSGAFTGDMVLRQGPESAADGQEEA